MNMYVIQNEKGHFVAKFGESSSYTKFLQDSQTFSSKTEAERHRCGNEIIIELSAVLAGGA